MQKKEPSCRTYHGESTTRKCAVRDAERLGFTSHSSNCLMERPFTQVPQRPFTTQDRQTLPIALKSEQLPQIRSGEKNTTPQQETPQKATDWQQRHLERVRESDQYVVHVCHMGTVVRPGGICLQSVQSVAHLVWGWHGSVWMARPARPRLDQWRCPRLCVNVSWCGLMSSLLARDGTSCLRLWSQSEGGLGNIQIQVCFREPRRGLESECL